MARHRDNSLKYYNRDVHDDDNLKFIQAANGLLGWAVVEKLRQKIYASPGGYYVPWNAVTERLFCNDNNISLEDFRNILENCFLDDIRLFSRVMYQKYKILTSSGIQKRWLKIVTECKRKNMEIAPEYSLIPSEESTLEPTNQPEYSGGSAAAPEILPNSYGGSTQIKLNETKGKEKKVTNTVSKEFVEVGTPANAEVPATAKKTDRKNSGKKRELPDSIQQVIDYISEKMKGKWAPARILTNADKLFNHYSANGWVQNKGKLIVSWKHAVNNWILNELNGVYGSMNGSYVNTSPATSQSSHDPPEKKLTREEKHQLSREFLQDCYQDYCNGGLLAGDDVLRFYFNDLIRDGLLILPPDEKDRIKKAANGDVNESKKIAVKEYFDKQKAAGVKRIYQTIVEK